MATLAERLRLQKHPYVICHADLHPANVIRDPAGDVFVIDWDEVMLAPKERDFIFVRHPHDDAFFRGYGEAAINEEALTYYRLERDIQDLIECAKIACNGENDSAGDDARQSALQLLQNILAGNHP
jgi:spectinomycin phosphotransferase